MKFLNNYDCELQNNSETNPEASEGSETQDIIDDQGVSFSKSNSTLISNQVNNLNYPFYSSWCYCQ